MQVGADRVSSRPVVVRRRKQGSYDAHWWDSPKWWTWDVGIIRDLPGLREMLFEAAWYFGLVAGGVSPAKSRRCGTARLLGLSEVDQVVHNTIRVSGTKMENT